MPGRYTPHIVVQTYNAGVCGALLQKQFILSLGHFLYKPLLLGTRPESFWYLYFIISFFVFISNQHYIQNGDDFCMLFCRIYSWESERIGTKISQKIHNQFKYVLSSQVIINAKKRKYGQYKKSMDAHQKVRRRYTTAKKGEFI